MSKIFPKKFKKIFWKSIYDYALYKDFLLVNDLIMEDTGTRETLCDHVLFGKKYIYLIYDYYFYGTLSGVIHDENWVYYEYNSKVRAITNPFKVINQKFKILKLRMNQDDSIFRLIILVNNQTNLNIKGKFNKATLIKQKDLVKTLNNYEKSPEADLSQEIIEETAKKLEATKHRNEK